jgi:hypothetical protein
MQLPQFLALAVQHPHWVAYALADGQPMRILGGEGKSIEARLPRKMQGLHQIEICLEPDDASSGVASEVPKGPVVLKGEVRPECALRPGWKCRIGVLDADDILDRRRAPRIHVHRMRLVGRIEGDSTWVFPVTVRDVGPDGLGVESHEPLPEGTWVRLSGFEEFTGQDEGEWRFEVRSSLRKNGAGLLIAPDQDRAHQFLKDMHAQLEIASRFWRSILSHAREKTGQGADRDCKVSIDFAVKQLRQRRVAQLAWISSEDLEALHQSLREEDELQRLDGEIALLVEKKKALSKGKRKRTRHLGAFLKELH